MDQTDYNAINERLRGFIYDNLEYLIRACDDKEIKNYLIGCVNGINMCRTLISGYVQREDKK